MGKRERQLSGAPGRDLLQRLKGRSRFLLLALLALILLYPVVKVGPFATYLVLALNWMVLVAGICAVADTRRHVVIAAALAMAQAVVATIALLVTQGDPMHRSLVILESVLIAVFYAYAIKRILTHILRGRLVTGETLYGGLAVYLMLGLAWSAVFAALLLVSPGSFQFAVDPHMHGGLELIYFSFVTLTTLGYGDITPLTDRARSLVILETVTGQLYLAVMVARLVSLYRPEGQTGDQ